jgi:penicillin-binding protein 1A
LLQIMKQRLLKILKITLFAAILPVTFLLIVYVRALSNLQNKKELLNYKNAAASVVLSQEGELIGKIFNENRTNILYDQIPTNLIHALIATEDARFYKHRGIDSRSLLRVLFKTILFNRKTSGGGSTITQQLAKNMFGRKITGLFAIFVTKTKEIMLARRIERVFSKTEILTLYFNTVPFGENVFGIEAASQRYFNKKVEKLNIEESAVLIGMLKANSLYNPRLYPDNAKKRRNVVLGQMLKYNYLEKSAADSLCKLPLVLNYSNLESQGPADYFLFRVKKEVKQILDSIQRSTGKEWNAEVDGLIVTTTLNLTLQNFANKSFRDHLTVMQKRLNTQYATGSGKIFIENLAESELKKLKLTESADEVGLRQVFDWEREFADSISVADSLKHTLQLLQAGLIALDPLNGAIKAWVGGIDFKTQPYDQILARRQMGSTFKPILYAAAFEEGINPCFFLENDSVTISGYEDWSPTNFDNSSGGKYSVAGSLVHSMNIPAFNLFLKIRFDGLDALWRNLGFSSPLMNTPALSMGIAEASIQELAVACSAFPNGGFKITPQQLVSIKSPDGEVIWQHEFPEARTRVLSDRTSRLMNAVLQKAVNEGTGSSMRSVYGVNLPVAGKTGTAHEYTDAWFIAYNPTLVVVSRVGASLPAVHFRNSANGSGSRLALPLVALTLKQVQLNAGLRNQLITPFPELSTDLASELECPDYKEKNALDNFMNIFKKDKITFDKEGKKTERKKKSFFKRLFKSD